MAGERDRGQWLLAKAKQLKERALETPDRLRRKHFLLIATEYQKLAQQEGALIDLNGVERALAATMPQGGVVTRLQMAHRQTSTAVTRDVPEGRFGRSGHALRRPEAVDMAIWAFLALVAFVMLLAPGDQTMQGLETVITFFVN